MKTPAPSLGLLRAASLLEVLFPNPADRPTRRWLEKMTKMRAVPCIRLSERMKLYDAAAVRAALEKFNVKEVG
jgi:alkylation response protein AidB-like acyl-CoA dehydrogenase